MPRAHPGLPRPKPTVLSKARLLAQLQIVDADPASRNRVLAMENDFRRKIDLHVAALPASESAFKKFNTSPFVLLIHSRKKNYTRVSELENDILPAKQFSSMETSAGRMVEEVVLPAYGWDCVESEMHTTNSALDGRKVETDLLRLVTLKSGPRCLNDEMSENFADAVVTNYRAWASESHASKIDFTYGVLYGTRRASNKKDWHILRNIKQKMHARGFAMTAEPENQWFCGFAAENVDVTVTIRIGLDWWTHLGGELCFIEVMTALIRACISPGTADAESYAYAISDMKTIVSTQAAGEDYNVALLQRSQLPWLMLMARHYCDELRE